MSQLDKYSNWSKPPFTHLKNEMSIRIARSKVSQSLASVKSGHSLYEVLCVVNQGEEIRAISLALRKEYEV